ncbi:AAA family ATPase [Rhizobium leguminosarum]|uniref:AAA family ATPase n=1 Tax=Rhizobium leguminosarum TaxID=384 RepID=A0AAJ1A5C0_RHILE|nr:AAA family ATPase [Rhizobium leguminosarum]MBY5519580.1 AAA family ATPase [Rhizobium leguminosarum]MBY5532075.1 AAA family ATPase [Rhizobium leguminosarum]MBY5539135.1 AAA family ATPase [Rhizobium leguminosarum]MBY5593379.1 AAA family ATPase [Rhizobium leguminosarum]MBY5613486.1 AAA family ATPase [Rhizobium leguminosarum]
MPGLWASRAKRPNAVAAFATNAMIFNDLVLGISIKGYLSGLQNDYHHTKRQHICSLKAKFMRIINQVSLRYYKSIGACVVDLSDLTVLVGPNGSGKSNFIDSLNFVSDALNSTLDFAIRQRSGLSAVRKRSGGHPTNFAIKLRISLLSGRNATYSFQVGAAADGSHKVQKEYLSVSDEGIGLTEIKYENGQKIFSSESIAPENLSDDRLSLQLLSSIKPVREVFDALSTMRFYNIYPEDFRLPLAHDSGEFLLRTGKNIASVIRNMEANYPYEFGRIREYMSQIVEQLEGIQHKNLGPSETIEFLQRVVGQKNPWRFFASQMSDGTLRSLGILVALFQRSSSSHGNILLGIEEPESTIHPAACAVITDAIVEASKSKQILITTHSPDLIDHEAVGIDNIRIVRSNDGDTTILPADSASKEVVRRNLMSPGDLLRKNQLEPDRTKHIQFNFWNN